MSLEEQLSQILIMKNLTLKSKDRQSYTTDADEIKNYIIGKMKESPSFKDCFRGTSLAGSYLDDVKIEKPDEFDILIILKLPFSMTVVKHKAWLYLRANTSSEQTQAWASRATDGWHYISREKLQHWIRGILERIFYNSVVINIPQTGRKYRLNYSNKGYAVAHTFSATSLNQNKREISFDFVPAFEFGYKDWVYNRKYLSDTSLKWFAVPNPNKRDEFEFNVSAPQLELELLKNKQNLKNSLRLLKALKDHNELTVMQSYVLKSVYLFENEHKINEYWEQHMGQILIDIIESLLGYMRKGFLPFYWENGINLLDRVKNSEERLEEYVDKFQRILRFLKAYKPSNQRKLREMFGINE